MTHLVVVLAYLSDSVPVLLHTVSQRSVGAFVGELLVGSHNDVRAALCSHGTMH